MILMCMLQHLGNAYSMPACLATPSRQAADKIASAAHPTTVVASIATSYNSPTEF
jgi:hypothetical protein